MSDKKQATSDKTSDYLLPCPFCGGEAKLQNLYRKRGWYVFCKNLRCGCRTPFYQHPFMHEDKLKALATTTWNTRKPMDALLEHLEEELNFADIEIKRCAQENPLQFDSAKGYAEGLYVAIMKIKEMLT